MHRMKTIAAIWVLMFGMSALPALGRPIELPAADSGRMEVSIRGAIYAEQILWAQNDTGEKEKTESSKPGDDTQESESAEDDKTKTTKSKPLKPFVPSEKIPGEQAVDFPVDI